MKKRLLSFSLASLMLVGSCPVTAMANDGTQTVDVTEEKAYADYYVQDGLVFFWSGEGYELGDTPQPLTALKDTRNGKSITQVALAATDPTPKDFTHGTTNEKETGGAYVVDKGVLFRTHNTGE